MLDLLTGRVRCESYGRWLCGTAGWALVLDLVLLAGCGSEPASVTQPPPIPPRPPAVAAPVAQRPMIKKAAPRPVRSAALRDEDPPNLYEAGAALPNFEARLSPHKFGRSTYAAITPTDGADSRLFAIVAPAARVDRSQVHPLFALPEGFSIVAAAGFDEHGIPRRLQCALDGSTLTYVPAGGFIQGHDGDVVEVGPAHPAFVSGFYIDLLEVTLRQYGQFRQATLTTKRPQQPANPYDPPEYPAIGVTWRDAANYARWVGKDLPTEAEWEKAARGAQGFEFPWGNDRAVWSGDRRPGQIDPVGAHPNDRSVYGVLDLAGNAREWCRDWYAPDTYLQAKTRDGSPPQDPTGVERAAPPNCRVIKGAGSAGWHLWAREGANMRDAVPNVGFRCVLRVTLPAEVTGTPPQP